MSSVQEMFKRVEVNPEVKQWEIDILLYELLDRLMDQYAPILDDFQESLDKLEELAIDNPPPEFLVTISDRKTELLNLRRIMTQQREISRETDAGRGAVHGPVVTDLFPGRS
ncbi:Mg2+ and Co2+ transporter CorA [Edaphobacter lichenicola]|uniref:Mg2+ and Co2+ transporter CorA n=2 Tax=Tunturiibacter gelidiferens TaxID=3069689 RepID=A0A9X0U633_9BACT|nr:Mg2+ and Co2+ transporter CorA [Edaphobacter lichenicola]